MDSQSRQNHYLAVEAGDCKKKSFMDKAKEHKKEIAIGAAVVLSVVAVVLIVKNREALMAVMKPAHIEDVLTNSLVTTNNTVPIITETIPKNIPGNSLTGITNVRGHIRNLPEGWKPSVSKLELAEKLGYCLDDHQTWVDSYTKLAA
ncbi:hypothetical protein LPY66_00685 [Dehalobacter sp. DCM]|uniref:hypothetical protein n=1 Tax=Dehalobacter sp. DCM TaxID=2907827 RepID=UPI003081D9FA|nr:hypothetical protein LPY66_00685 [Dehalobacter sp. DCM]